MALNLGKTDVAKQEKKTQSFNFLFCAGEQFGTRRENTVSSTGIPPSVSQWPFALTRHRWHSTIKILLSITEFKSTLPARAPGSGTHEALGLLEELSILMESPGRRTVPAPTHKFMARHGLRSSPK